MQQNQLTPQQLQNQPHTQVVCSQAWVDLQQELGFSLLMGTRVKGDLHLVSVPQSTGVNIHVQQFPLCMGIILDGEHLHVACETDVRSYHNILSNSKVTSTEYQKCYVPRELHFTGNLDVHEMDVQADGSLLVVSAKYSCIGSVSATHSFKAVWKPSFIDALQPEDRCHLNGLCMENGALKYVTLFAQSNKAHGWREMSYESGLILDAVSQDVVCAGLIQPHSPRLYKGELYVLNSGAGEFGRVDLKTGKFDSIAYVAGYGRGLSFVGDYAIFGLSKARRDEFQPGLKLHQRLRAMSAVDRCCLIAVNIHTGEIIEGILFEGAVRELFDTKVIENCRHAYIANMDEAQNPALVVIDAQAVLPAASFAESRIEETSVAQSESPVPVHDDEAVNE